MKITRRDFLKLTSLSAVGAVACNVFDDREMTIQSPSEMPEDLVTGSDNWYATLCQQCPEREGILVRVMEGRAKKVRGNPKYPTNMGKQSARCEAGLQALYHPDRLAKPRTRIAGTPRGEPNGEIGWDEAVEILRGRLEGLGDRSEMLMITGPLRGHMGAVASRFVETYGGRHLAFEPLEQTVLREAVKRVFAQDILPDYDIENASYLLSFGADFLSTWVAPVRFSRGFGEFRSTADGGHRGTFVHADPRYSMTAASADEWLPVKPGMEGVLALSMAQVIISEDLADAGVVNAMSGGGGKEALQTALEGFQPERVVASIGIPETIRDEPAADVIKRIARAFATSRPSLAIGGGEAAAHTNGLFNLSAIFALNYLVGSVGKQRGEGGIVFNPPPPIEGLPAGSAAASMTEWFTVTDDLKNGRIKVLIIYGANPVHGLPSAVTFPGALDNDDLFIVSVSNFLDDTALMADLVLPDGDSFEQWGSDVPEPGPGYEIVGMQQPVVSPLIPELDPRSFPDLLLVLSQELGLDIGLPTSFYEVLREGARELFELGRGSPEGGSDEAPTFGAFWNSVLQQGGWWDEGATSQASAPAPLNLVDLAQQAAGRSPSFRSPSAADGNIFYLVPFLSNSLLDGRGAHLPWLQAAPDPLTTVTWQTWIEINTRKARDMGLKEGDIVRVVSTEDSIEAIVYPHPAVPPDVVGIPLGQGHTLGLQYASKGDERRGSNPIAVLAPEFTEVGSLAWAATRVLVQPTGRSTRVSKFEGLVPAFPIGTRAEDIVQVTRE